MLTSLYIAFLTLVLLYALFRLIGPFVALHDEIDGEARRESNRRRGR